MSGIWGLYTCPQCGPFSTKIVGVARLPDRVRHACGRLSPIETQARHVPPDASGALMEPIEPVDMLGFHRDIDQLRSDVATVHTRVSHALRKHGGQ